MKAREERNIILTMNPDELRALANKMERRWEKITMGQTTFVEFLHFSDELKISLHLDQDYFHRKEGGR